MTTCFNTLRNYTPLKRQPRCKVQANSFNTLRNYTPLKLVQLNLWSRNGFESFPNVEAAMLAAGFLFQAERDMDYNENTGHFGQSKDFLFYEEKG